MVDLACQSKDEQVVSITSIAKRQQLSESYLEQLLRKLREAGIVQSVRGANGGYILAKDASEITVGDVLRALEGDILAVNCGEDGTGCGQADLCATRFVWDKVNAAIEGAVDSVKLSELVQEAEEKRSRGTMDAASCAN